MKGGSYGNNDDILQRCYYRHRTHVDIPRHSTFNRLEKEMTINSRQKGARFERELARKLSEYGFECRRGQQFSGANGDADVVGLPFIHIEAKNVQRLNIRDAMAQSERDAREDETPVVMHKKDRMPILVTLNLDDFMTMYKRWLDDWSEDE